jgi:hypothetical protein
MIPKVFYVTTDFCRPNPSVQGGWEFKTWFLGAVVQNDEVNTRDIFVAQIAGPFIDRKYWAYQLPWIKPTVRVWTANTPIPWSECQAYDVGFNGKVIGLDIAPGMS